MYALCYLNFEVIILSVVDKLRRDKFSKKALNTNSHMKMAIKLQVISFLLIV